MRNRRDLLLRGLGAAASATLASAVRAAALDYPVRPVRWIVPYAAAGATDVLSRIIAQRLTERLGQPFIVENKPGGGSTVGTQFVINAPPDGYTLLLTSTANAINASFDPQLPFNFARSIAPVAGLARIPLVLVVNNDIPARDVRQFITYARARAGRLNVASSGVGTSLHLSGVRFNELAETDLAHVPYGGSAPALTALMAGEVQAMFDNVTSSLEFIRAGKIRALGVTVRRRSPALPDTPPIADTLPGFETSSFYGLGAPAGLPVAIAAVLNREVNAALADPAIAARIDDLAAEPLHGTPADFAAMLGAETERWRTIVTASRA